MRKARNKPAMIKATLTNLPVGVDGGGAAGEFEEADAVSAFD